ncbi:MAG: hypothetical protein IJZ68_05690 [Bacteroidaceae bacterium]|nr:hypothetical protein [Bacteroidaceae bacterium]
MKKIVSLLLVCLMVFSLAACNSDSGWKTKNINAPEIKLEWQENGQVDPAQGISITDNLILSPLTFEKHNVEDDVEALKKLEFTKDWVSEKQYSEQGTPHYFENGQLTSYRYGTRFSIHENSDTGKGFIVYYSADTDTVIGYSTVAIEFIPNEAGENLTQAQILNVLKIVFGDEYAEFLCYAKMTQDEEVSSHTVTNGDASMKFERYIDKEGYVTFGINVSNTNPNQTNGYSGEFRPHMDQVAVLGEVLRWNTGDSPLDIKNMGNAFLEKHYGEGAYFYASNQTATGAYIYSDEGAYQTTMMSCAIAQPDVKEDKWLGTTMTISNSESATETYCMFEIANMGSAALDADRTAAKDKALAMVKDILNREDVEAPFAEDNHFEMTLSDGTKVLIIFRFKFEKDSNGNEYALLTFATTTDLTYLDQ